MHTCFEVMPSTQITNDIPLIDTHSHLDSDQFDGIRATIMENTQRAGIHQMISIGCSWGSSQKCLYLTSIYNNVFASVGIHPNYTSDAALDHWDRIVKMTKHPRVVALGETGLDRYWDFCPFDLQQDYFDRHIRLSQKTGIPFVVHMRECEQDILDMLIEARARGPLRGVMHSFTGDLAMAEKCLELGMYISFAGMVTFKKNEPLRKVAAAIPLDRMLVETDSPYLSPHPLRSNRPNQPAFMLHTAQCLADAKEIPLQTLAKHTVENTYRLFNRMTS
ncbi:MAG: TatD family hydrolase [Pirellulales bacterium]|jgi:TatD DNase family protein|nr:TatD family hydrolase [Pirellulales bacterium]|tara:strand:+ start:813 stop:1643 length:831 start_codon:yes stop_codon:yes gene_type:complete